MLLIDLLIQQRNRKFVGTTELAEAATEMILKMGQIQDRGTVKEVVEERTVRYYQSEGLLETPSEKKGTASVFGYKHLLTLVVIKTMQSKNLPIRRIKEIIRGRSEAELEQLKEEFSGEGPLPLGPGSEARKFLESLSEPEEWEPKVKARRSPRLMMKAPKPPKRDEDEGQALPEVFSMRALSRFSTDSVIPALMSMLESTESEWTRHELEAGIELHIRRDSKLRLTKKHVAELLEKIKTLLKAHDDR
ncbi:MAG: MerR family transcriptional regulator [Acidobacteriota bacterium]